MKIFNLSEDNYVSYMEKLARPNHYIPNGHSDNQLTSQINAMHVMCLVFY